MKTLVVLVGPIGAGKSTSCKHYSNYTRINQDELGSKGHRKAFKEALDSGEELIVIDRMNFNSIQRSRYIVPAREAGYSIHIIEFKTPRATCLERVVSRYNHPTVAANDEALANKILDFYEENYEPVTRIEYDIYEVYNG